MSTTLFDGTTDQAARWTGTRLPAVFDGPIRCAHCDAGTVIPLPAYTTEPLFYHGGYGEARRVTAAWCPACARTTTLTVESVRPARSLQQRITSV